MSEEKENPKPHHLMPLDVRFMAGLCILGAVGGIMNAYRFYRIDRGGFLLGTIHTDATWIVVLYYLGLAAYMALTAKGLWGMHRYGFWMFVVSVWVGILLAPFHMNALHHAVPNGHRTIWVTFLGVGHVCNMALAFWCFFRWRLFIMPHHPKR